MNSITLETPIRYLPHVGPNYADKLARLEIYSVKDLFYHLPFRYDNFTLMSNISRLQQGEVVSVVGLIESIKNIFTKNGKKITEAVIGDETGKIKIIWFNQHYLIKTIRVMEKYVFSGKVDYFGNKTAILSPQFEIWQKDQRLHTGRLVPVYPETDGVSSKWLRNRIAYLLKDYAYLLEETLPSELLKEGQFMDLKRAVGEVHFPKSLAAAEKARERLAFDELFFIQLASLQRKKAWREETAGHILQISKHKDKIAALLRNLPFTLTNSQKRALGEIFADLAHKYPMNRLLEGDVGSGKTVVAALAMHLTYLNGFQSALMAPTEILAQQHFKTVSDLLTPFGIKVILVTSSTKYLTPNTKHLSNDQRPDVLIGTHSLLQEKVSFTNLGLVVIDEQQRFGVQQRETLQKKGINPHLLTMTATPIPRTIALTLYGELDLSILTDMPKGRQKIKTWLIPEEKRQNAYEWIKEKLEQMFVICPLIEESETLQTVKAANSEYEKIKNVFSNFRVGLLHGKLKAGEKEKVLNDFRDKKLDILVATPVVEVGIDIAGANIMLIEAADRFGLSQLHQLRGRVGRNNQQAYCLLFTQLVNENAHKRLKALESVHSGPELAELDLKLRGPGEILGTKQHGIVKLKAARFTDQNLIEKARNQANLIVNKRGLGNYPRLYEMLQEDKTEKVLAN